MHHKWLVFKLSCKLGIPFRGFMHDWSKFSFDEFWESVKYYDGKMSPITKCIQEKGFSMAALSHKGKNKHHVQYWIDIDTEEVCPVIPYKYMAEMVCDKMAANIIYNGKNWSNSSQYEYWQKEKTGLISNPKIEKFLDVVFLQIKDEGIDKTLTRKNIKQLYKKYCIDDKTKYKYEFHGTWKCKE